ncbi:MAG TPA: nitrate/sulfonate/bicarbonate ABC transporter ATP-binding protein [Planctomycetaceae bacterium]|nr:nitrate/sulfonate/bicarbonate ABC transporter ATP-binding protein [Planctomycetaceae bacterium]
MRLMILKRFVECQLSLMQDSPKHKAGIGINIDALRVRFGDDLPVLDELSLEVRPGEILALVGASGCGKSTLLRTLAGLQSISSGRVELVAPDKKSNAEGLPHKRSRGEISFVFQQPTLLPWRTAFENVRLPAELEGNAAPDERITESLKAVGLPREHFRKRPSELSGGMQMRVSLARAILSDPSVLLLDEPFAALDDLLRTRMNELLLNMHAERSRTILLVTHNISEAIFLSHRVAVLANGRIAELITNDLPWPRNEQLKGELVFAERYSQVSHALGATAC